MIFLFQFEKNTMWVGPQNEKSSWSGLNSTIKQLSKDEEDKKLSINLSGHFPIFYQKMMAHFKKMI